MTDDKNLGDAAAFAGKAKRPSASEVSLGDELTIGGGGDTAGIDAFIDDIEVIDVESRFRFEDTFGQGGMGAAPPFEPAPVATHQPKPRKAFYLHGRCRDRTMKLFAKHGMESLIYWRPLDILGSDRTLGYLLARQSVEAAKKSFDVFRSDPDWLAAREASEKKAGGALTEKEVGESPSFSSRRTIRR